MEVSAGERAAAGMALLVGLAVVVVCLDLLSGGWLSSLIPGGEPGES
jgi:hypothetical protein